MSFFLSPEMRGPCEVPESAALLVVVAGDDFEAAKAGGDWLSRVRLSVGAGATAGLALLGTPCQRPASALARSMSSRLILPSQTPLSRRLPFRDSSPPAPTETN